MRPAGGKRDVEESRGREAADVDGQREQPRVVDVDVVERFDPQPASRSPFAPASAAIVQTVIRLLPRESPDDLECERGRTSALDELGERMPVDEVGASLCDDARQSQPSELLCAPRTNDEHGSLALLESFVFDGC
jgi:hypothetical protein